MSDILGFDCWVVFSRQGAETSAAGILEFRPPGCPPVGSPQVPVEHRYQWARCGSCPTGRTPDERGWFDRMVQLPI